MTVSFIKQLSVGFCGAACAQMVLHSRGLIGTSPREQRELFEEIKSRTTGKSSAPPGFTDRSPCPGFPNKVCESCGSGLPAFCWCTHPDALRATMRARFPSSAINVSKHPDEDRANERIEACLAAGVPPIVLVNSGQHWVVVDGFDRTAEWGVTILNPAMNGQIGIRIGLWNASYLASPPCGRFQEKHVVVGANQ